jgi:hypothetical protein
LVWAACSTGGFRWADRTSPATPFSIRALQDENSTADPPFLDPCLPSSGSSLVEGKEAAGADRDKNRRSRPDFAKVLWSTRAGDRRLAARPRGVSHEVFDHTSIIKTCLVRFCRRDDGFIPDMGARVSAANHLRVLLDKAVQIARPPEAALKKLAKASAQAAVP